MTEPSQNSRLLTASFHISSRPVAPLVHVPMSCETAIVGSWHVHITHVLLEVVKTRSAGRHVAQHWRVSAKTWSCSCVRLV